MNPTPAPGTGVNAALVLQCEPAMLRAGLHEPLWVLCTLHNPGEVPQRIDLGTGGVAAFHLDVQGPPGAVARPDSGAVAGFGASGVTDLAAGATSRHLLLLQCWQGFELPGAYAVDISCRPEGADAGLVPKPVSMQVEVTGRRGTRLAVLCAQLAERAEQGHGVAGGLHPFDAALALSWVVDDTATPYLARLVSGVPMLRPLALEGLARIASPEARSFLQRWSHDADPELAALAKRALRPLGGARTAD
ncbi:MAG: HEAT repeat domain-containing protein [Rubrivivax sp.]|nr:HEAT repeat domain-containing protein [Rubrivivax sp.]